MLISSENEGFWEHRSSGLDQAARKLVTDFRIFFFNMIGLVVLRSSLTGSMLQP